MRGVPSQRRREHGAPKAKRFQASAQCHWRLAVILSASAFIAGCRIDVLRVRTGTPIAQKEFDELKTGETTLEESLEKLGAPDRVDIEPGDDFLWYEYGDRLDVGIRFRLPTPIPFYQHNFVRLNEISQDLNAIQLIFDDDGVLKEKSVRVSPAYSDGASTGRGWKLHVIPRFSHSVLTLGDAGVDDYDELFDDGFRAGLDLGFQPVPVLKLLVGGSFQEHQGRTRILGGNRVAFDDLQMVDVHAGVRMAAPVQVFTAFTDFDYVKRLLFDEKLNQPQGFRIYLEGTTGATFSFNTPVAINGVRAGNFYDNSVQTSSTVGLGFEYGWNWGLVYLGGSYQTIDAFDEGSSPIDDDAGGWQAIFVTGGLDLRF